jgi:hypothetical protein
MVIANLNTIFIVMGILIAIVENVGADLRVCPDVSAQGAMIQNDDDKRM